MNGQGCVGGKVGATATVQRERDRKVKEIKLSDEELVKTYKRCISGSSSACEKCPYRMGQHCKIKNLSLDILELIQRLKVEVKGYEGISRRADELEEENEKLKQALSKLQ